MEKRARLVLKYLNFLLTWLVLAALVLIWGIRKKDILLALSSITTVIGVAMFAQWSILSNITSGIIVFFFFPYRIGDTIKILDKDFPLEGFIEDISAFHLTLRTSEGEHVTYPNNLLLQKGVAVVSASKNISPFED